MRGATFWVIAAATAFYFFGFGSTPEKPAPAGVASSMLSASADDSEREDTAAEAAADDLSGETFESVGDTSACTDDCSGHDAGFEWAKDHAVTEASECGGRSQSFIEGCETYAEAVQEGDDERDENGEEL